MKTATRKKQLKISPTKVYRAWQSASTTIDGVPHAVRTGDKLKGDDPLVRRLGGEVFVEDSVSVADQPTPWDESIAALATQDAEKREAEAAVAKPSTIDAATPIGAFMMCTTQIVSSAAGPCGKGTIVLANDPRINLAPECFRPLHLALALG